MSVKPVLIFGATGKQGGSVLRALLAHPSFSPSSYSLLAVTRNTESPSAKQLAALSPAVKLVTGDLHDAAGTFKNLPTQPWAVYTMTQPGKSEAQDGISIVDEAMKAGVSHFVFSSVDRGPAEERNSPTQVPHFITKHEIEQHLRQQAEKSKGKFSYTIIRPPFFMDNLEPGFFGRVFTTVWRDNVKGPMSCVDTSDVGRLGALALLKPNAETFFNRALNIAGDRLTFSELDEKFRAKTGKPIPTTYSWINPGFAATPEESNQLLEMTSVDQWLDQVSKHTQKNK